MFSFAGKKILLVAPVYFGYERVIEACLTNCGAEVTYIENKSFRYDPLNKGTRRHEAWFCKKHRYIDKISAMMDQAFDLCLFVNLFSFQSSFVDTLRKRNPSIRCVLYLWDNVKYYRWQHFFPVFDEVFTFDPVEAKQHNFHYLPNFYCAADLSSDPVPVFDYYFVGSFQSHRFYWLEHAARVLEQANRTYYFYLYVPDQYNRFVYNKLVYWGTRLFPSRFRGYKAMYDLIFRRVQYPNVYYEPLTLGASISKMMQAKCVIDLPFPTQTGATQRVIQALAFNKTVVTTNRSVTQDSFFDSRRIRVISTSERFQVSGDDVKLQPEPEISHLRIDNWLKRLFS